MSPDSAVRVMIVDDHAVVREGIAAVLAGQEDITVAGAASNAAEALERCGEVGAEVVLMDLSMPDIDGAAATALLRQRYPDVKIVVLTGLVAANDAVVRAAVRAGAMACLLKTVGVDELAEAIRGVTHGRSTFSSELLPHLLHGEDEAAPAIALTPRERDILPLLASGLTNKSIAHELGLTEGTVRVYISALLTKLGAANRTEATAVALREGLIDQRQTAPGPSNDHP